MEYGSQYASFKPGLQETSCVSACAFALMALYMKKNMPLIASGPRQMGDTRSRPDPE